MSSARGSRDEGMTEYERQKWEKVARNKEMIESLRLRQLTTALQPPPQQQQPTQPNKRTKVSLVL